MRTSTFGLAIALLVVSSACAGGDGELSRGEYVAAADGICRGLMQKQEAIPRPTSEAQALANLGQVVAVMSDARDEFSDLDPPKTAESVHAALTSSSPTRSP